MFGLVSMWSAVEGVKRSINVVFDPAPPRTDYSPKCRSKMRGRRALRILFRRQPDIETRAAAALRYALSPHRRHMVDEGEEVCRVD